MLQRQVERALPAIVDKVRGDLRDAKKQLSVLGGPPPKTDREKVFSHWEMCIINKRMKCC